MADNKYHVINDPIHGLVELSSDEKNLIKTFIDHPLFQRLRYIKQLGLADLVYPGAVHTRFSHMIGTCYLAKKIVEKFEKEIKDMDGEKYEELKNITMIAALLHDVTHGPFSHAFERLFSDTKIIKHADWTKQFLEEFKKDEKCAQYLTDKRFENIISLISDDKNENSEIPIFFKNIISSQLDADRLDYLLRDSYFCGVSYGLYNVDWMIHCLAIIDTRSSNNENKNITSKYRYRLGINKKGIGTTEQFLYARRLMNLYVYKHKKVNAAEHLIESFLKKLRDHSTETNNSIGIDENLLGFMSKANDYKEDTECKKENFIENSFKYYKELTDVTIYNLIKKISQSECDLEGLKDICNRIYERKLPIAREIVKDKEDLAKERADEFQKSKSLDWKLQYSKPEIRIYKDSEDKIFIQDSGTNFHTLKSESRTIDFLSDKNEGPSYILVDIETNEEDATKKFIKDLEEDGIITEEQNIKKI